MRLRIFAGFGAFASVYLLDRKRRLVDAGTTLSGSDLPPLKITNHWDYNWDGRNTPELKGRRSRTIILVRHGIYNHGGDVEEGDCGLTDLGRQQAALTGLRMNIMRDYDFDTVINSSMPRAIETADIMVKQIDRDLIRLEDPLLDEGFPYLPEPEHYKRDEIKESWIRSHERIESAFQKYFHRATPEQKEDSVEVIVCHGNVIRYFVCRALQLPPEAWLRLSLAHCSLTIVTIRPSGRVGCRAIGDAGHLPPSMITYAIPSQSRKDKKATKSKLDAGEAGGSEKENIQPIEPIRSAL